MDIIIIHEDNHGVIAVAKDYDSALRFLIKYEWLSLFTEVMDTETEKWVTLYELNISLESMKEWGIEKFNDFFTGNFFLELDKLRE